MSSNVANRPRKQKSNAGQQSHDVAAEAGELCESLTGRFATEPCRDLAGRFQSYARQHPDVAAVWAFGIGFLIGWRLKP